MGALLVAISLQLFLIKNYVIDGGVIGIGIILSHITGLQIGLLLLLLNIPFFFIGYAFLGKRFFALSFFAIFVLTIGTNLLEPIPAITNNPVFVIIFGGICLGLGVGIIIRFGGCLDGTEVMAILFSRRTRFTIGQYVLLFNVVIFGSAIFIFGLQAAVYSLATFCVACKTIDILIKD
ncbi:hypothetical protein AM1BK_34010 [Neobacillus kokaensis]|uniref:YitT family protein n=1 Tax=Neobacillus kokaensis TaxID=2759023 RepID=A0ABQ3N8I2_9BACI|nr:hypothetical protein AM1BK_34010 [Neobacillus kokaensis]